jgi:RNA polymerase-binding transcription factor DksA
LARDCCAPDTSPVKLDDLTDAASDQSAADLSMVAASATKDAIFEVLAAILRIERGTYGICELTGEPIEAERLEAIPWARYSFQGQHELEKTGKLGKHRLPEVSSLSDSGDEDGESEDE